jgi:hypothetical protein
VRLVPAPGSATTAVASGDSTTCHDLATFLPERIPLAAPAPKVCAVGGDVLQAPIVLSPASSLLAYDPKLTQKVLRQAAGLPSEVVIGRFDALQAALEGDPVGDTMLKFEIAIKNTVVSARPDGSRSCCLCLLLC